jgi:drug/metabolite transporter (DMT)-like permease
MFGNYTGEIAALTTSLFWTISALTYESAGKKIGAIPLNIIRLFIAFIYITIYTYFSRGLLFATDASMEQWQWLLLSGIIGFVIGDLLLFQAFIVIGARVSMLIMSLVPPIAAILGWIILGETLNLQQIFAMAVTVSGIAIVMIVRKEKKTVITEKKSKKLSVTIIGLLLALGGALGQAGGLVISKKGMGEYDAFAATQIRIIAGIFGFLAIIAFTNLWKKTWAGLKNISALKSISLGSFVGPFLGVSFSLIAVKHAETGIAATLMSLAPILIIFPSMIINKEKVKFLEILGAIISVLGVGLFFL